jgi:signal transduction histidine kinase/ActR/RegA family two-component response regulator
MIRLGSIRKKLVAVVMSTTLAAVAVSVATVIAYDLRAYQRALVNDLSTQAQLVGHMAASALASGDAPLADDDLALLRARPAVRAAAIYDAGGKLFASWLAPGAAHAAFPSRPQAGKPRFEGGDVVISERIVDHGTVRGTVYLRAGHDLMARTLDYLAVAAGVTLLALLTAWLVMQRLGRVITAPILAITRIAHEVVATRDYSRRAPRTSNDEAAALVVSFNAMLTEIEQRTRELESSKQQVMRMNEELERRVDERTMQLALANAELGQAIEQARSASRAKSAFLSSMSHELRTPLNAILGFAQILTSDALPATPAQRKEFASHILNSGRHLLTLINEILDLAKVESGTVALAMESVALTGILAECQAMIAPLAAARHVELLFPAACEQVVLADRMRLKQVLLNLLSNAVKYNRDGGSVTLDCGPGAPGRLRLSVRDTGHGLRQEQLDKLFQPFNRLGQESGAQEGTGIGLVLTRRLVELMNGTIAVESSVGAGSVFRVELEAAAPPAVAGAAGAAAAIEPARTGEVSTSQRLLLYIEDNPANLTLVEEIVRFRPDLRLLATPDGPLGLAQARRHLPDVILLDLNLGGMSGLEVLRELRRDRRTERIPTIALTASAMPGDIEHGLAAGFFRYLTKPLDIARFNDAIDSALAGGSAANRAA